MSKKLLFTAIFHYIVSIFILIEPLYIPSDQDNAPRNFLIWQACSGLVVILVGSNFNSAIINMNMCKEEIFIKLKLKVVKNDHS